MIYINESGRPVDFRFVPGRGPNLLREKRYIQAFDLVSQYLQWAPAHDLRFAISESGALRHIMLLIESKMPASDTLLGTVALYETHLPAWTATARYVLVPGSLTPQQLADRFGVPLVNCAVADPRRGFGSYCNRILLREQLGAYNILESK